MRSLEVKDGQTILGAMNAMRNLRTNVPPQAMESICNAFARLHGCEVEGPGELFHASGLALGPNPNFIELLESGRLAQMVWRYEDGLPIVQFRFYIDPPTHNYKGRIQNGSEFCLRACSRFDFTRWEVLL